MNEETFEKIHEKIRNIEKQIKLTNRMLAEESRRSEKVWLDDVLQNLQETLSVAKGELERQKNRPVQKS